MVINSLYGSWLAVVPRNSSKPPLTRISHIIKVNTRVEDFTGTPSLRQIRRDYHCLVLLCNLSTYY